MNDKYAVAIGIVIIIFLLNTGEVLDSVGYFDWLMEKVASWFDCEHKEKEDC